MTEHKRRLNKLEQATGADKDKLVVWVNWGNEPRPELQPGTKVKVLTWEADDTISEKIRIVGEDGE